MRDAMPRETDHRIAHINRHGYRMRHILIELTAAVALTVGAIIASISGASANEVMVIDAYARASATPVARSGAAYLSIVNQGSETDRLLAISTPSAASAQLHRTEQADGVARMAEADSIDLPPGTTLSMDPGGLHVMLMGLKAPLKEGSTLELVLTFEKAGEARVVVPVKGVAAGQASGG